MLLDRAHSSHCRHANLGFSDLVEQRAKWGAPLALLLIVGGTALAGQSSVVTGCGSQNYEFP